MTTRAMIDSLVEGAKVLPKEELNAILTRLKKQRVIAADSLTKTRLLMMRAQGIKVIEAELKRREDGEKELAAR